MSEEIISFIDFTVMSDEEKYKLLNIRDNRISSLKIVNEELEYKLQQKENIIKELKERSLSYSKEIDKLLDFKEKVGEYVNTYKNCVPKHIKDYINDLLDKENK